MNLDNNVSEIDEEIREDKVIIPSVSEMNQPFKMMFFYQISLFFGSILFSIIVAINQKFDKFDIVESTAELSVFFSAVFGIIIVMYFCKPKELLKYITNVSNKMTLLTLLKLLLLVFSFNAALIYMKLIIESLFNSFDYTTMSFGSSYNTITFNTFIYLSVIGPICEEIVFRGALLRMFSKYGKIFAIIVSAILFGLIHSNINQGLNATCMGIVLAYTTLEYSLKWSIMLHMINNFIVCLLILINSEIVAQIFYGIFSLLFIFVLTSVWKNREKIKVYIIQNNSSSQLYTFAFKRIWAILFIAFNVLMIILTIKVV